MMDFGLLMSVIVALAVPAALARRRPLLGFEEGESVIDVFVVPGAVGLLVGRLVTLALDDPRSIGGLSDMLVIRSGVEFWPAVLSAALVVAWQSRRAGVQALTRLAGLAPWAMVGYASYEAACIFRDGCFGPVGSLGLKPDGMDQRMFPIGLALGVAVASAAAFVTWVHRLGWPPLAIVASATALVALARSWASIWLPRVGEAMTRQQRSSIVVAILAATACLVEVWLQRHQRTSVVSA
ncbi:hypothetical protein KSP35_20325 [Aquihabitans sp. G128]|uniref:hypothetical protein n=1 Tax=Aquihabitans sp. G128 TaxID=2849779 RepID=UPI001C223605|nr:hypothetical protein [Aquihabitans sp. G128]QXC60640.1 hypothetical protein KSP35_20325 [Aquihabitans sp. G128]